MSLSLLGVIAPMHKFVGPELTVWLLIFGSCAVVQWRTQLKSKREDSDTPERQSPDTQADPLAGQVRDSRDCGGQGN
jgi:hypothetical protein